MTRTSQVRRSYPSSVFVSVDDEKDWVEKKYPKTSFVDSVKVRDRMKRISLHRDLISPVITISETEQEWIVRQKKCNGKRSDGLLTCAQIYNLAKQVDQWHQAGFFHGDLSFSNLFVSGNNGIEVIDWEPALEILVADNKVLRTTGYCLHPDDLRAGLVTAKSDYFTLVTYCLGEIKGTPCFSQMAIDLPFRNEISKKIECYFTAEKLVKGFIYG